MDKTHSTGRARDRALLVGATTADAERLAPRLGSQAQVICLTADRETGDAVRQALAARVPGARVAVMLGDPALLVHKIAGPFDIIVDRGRARDASDHGARRQDRLRSLLSDGGELYG